MADKSIGDLDRALQINDNDLFVLEQSGAAKSLTGKKVKDYVYRDIDNASATTLPSSSQATANYDSDTHTMAFGIPAGKSAYEAAVEGGYTETEAQFNHDLSGIDEVVKYDDGEIGQTLPSNADRLNGHPDSYFAKQADLTATQHTHTNKSILDQITQAMLDLISTITQKYSAANPPPYPVTSVNGQTGDVVLNYITFDEEEES